MESGHIFTKNAVLLKCVIFRGMEVQARGRGTQMRSPDSQGSSDLLSYITIYNICVLTAVCIVVYG